MSPATTMNAVTEYCNQTGRDISMTALIALGVQNIASHAGLMVEAPGHPAMPTGLFFAVVAPSGCGKTSTMNTMSTSLRRFADEECESALSRMEADPTAPPAPIIYHSDSTTEEVLDSFRHQTATAILTSEGAMMTDLQHRGPPAAFNDAFSGEGIRQRRIGRPAVSQPNAKLAILMTTQPDPFLAASEKNNSAGKVNGYDARNFYVMPVTRGYAQTFTSGAKSTPDLDAYCARNYQMLKITQRDKRAFKIKMDAQAQELWYGLRDWSEAMLTSGQWNGHHQAWLLRLPEKTLRLAAQFRFSESLDGSDVDALSMHRAIAWGHWFAGEYMRLFGPLGLLTREVRDAEVAWQVLVEYVTTYRDFDYLNQTTIDTLCQEQLKTKARIQKALKLLVHNGQLFPVKLGKAVAFQMHPSIIDNAFRPAWQVTYHPQQSLGYGLQCQPGGY
jgi:hypothetical protein